MKIKIENMMNKKAGVSYLQILILMASSFAFSYLVYSATEASALEGMSEEEQREEEIKNSLLYEIYGDYEQTTEILSQEIERDLSEHACCEKTEDGKYCQFVKNTKCDSNFTSAPTECKNTDYCKLGCCYSAETGLCSANTPERSCQESEGIWEEDAACNIAECQRGCCVLGRNALWTTGKNCQKESGFLGLETDFRTGINTEVECIFLAEKDDEGACVFEEDLAKTCEFTTRENCKSIDGDFYKDTFCSDPGLGTGCKAKDHAACAENKNNDGQSVYWFDSCGNKEEAKEECSIFLGTICKPSGEDYICKSLDCEAKNGKNYKNGESWCEYDGYIGEGKDVVGSRHWKHICFMGEERIESCDDYRNQICVSTETKFNDGKTFSEAACRINNWRSCLNYNLKKEGDMTEECKQNPDCIIKGVHIDKFSFNMCVPEYPAGFDLTTEEGAKNAESVCSFASQKCKVIYIKDYDLNCKCEHNCGCEESGFAQQMNELCTSLGDCGAYTNTAGEVTDDGYTVKGSPKLGRSYLNKLSEYAKPVKGQKADPGNLSFLGKLGLIEGEYIPGESDNVLLYTGAGMLGVSFLMGVYSFSGFAIGEAVSRAASAFAGGVGPMHAGTSLAPFGDALAGAGAALAATSIAIMVLGMEGKGANLAMIVGAVYAAYVAISVIYFGAELSFFICVDLFTCAIFIAILIIIKILGIGEVCKEKTVSFDCKPWQPPTGGTNCEKCNEDAFKPCSKYRCSSLGQTCKLINPGTEQELCIDSNPGDVASPIISPLLGRITEGYQYSNIQDTGFEVLDLHEECIPEFTSIGFGIKTDKPSQCKIGTDPLQSYDEMPDFFGGSNSFIYNHTATFNFPSIAAFKNKYNLTDAQIKELGKFVYYVKCKSVNGVENAASYTIKTCIKPGPDLTAPRITNVYPKNGAYIKYGVTEKDLQVWTNEPANCRWSAEDKGKYEMMENSMSCYTNLEEYESFGWKCNTTLTDLDENSKFFIKCRDTSENNNSMRQSYVYELKKSESELRIDEILPRGEITVGFEPVTVTLEATTSGGADGTAKCLYSFDGKNYIRFLETFSDYHKQVFTQITGKEYNIRVKCEDTALNTAENATEFNVKVDNFPPVITRVYYDGSLKIITDENAVCGYSLKDCKFKVGNSTLMTGEGKEHSADWQSDASYYVKCKDEYKREPDSCSIIVRAYDLI